MTPSFVQSTSTFSSAGTSSLACPFVSGVTSGNRIVVAVGATGGGVTNQDAFSVTDSEGNAYAIDEWGEVGGYWTAIFSAEAGSSAANTVTLSISGGGAFVRLAIHEYSGLAGLDASRASSGLNSGTVDSGLVETVQPSELVFGWLVSNAGVTSAGSGFTLRETVSSESTMDQIVSAVGQYNVTAPTSNSDWIALVATYASSPATVGGLATDTPENHGAARDGVTDDTAAINSAVSAVVTAGIGNGSYYGEVHFTPGIYAVKGALTTGSPTYGNAQIPLPVILDTDRKFTLVFKGVTDASALPHWLQTSVQTGGVILRSYDNSPGDGTHGSASVVGGPTWQQYGANTFSNMLFVVDGIAIVSRQDPRHVAWDFQALAEVSLPSLSANASTTPGQFAGNLPLPSHGGAGIRMPAVLNNDNCEAGNVSVEGYQYGLIPSEHTNIKGLRIVYCQSGIWLESQYSDAARIEYASIETCKYHVDASNVGSGHRCRLDIGVLDIEDGITTYHIYDPADVLYGDITYERNDTQSGGGLGANVLVNGAAHVRYINSGRSSGAATAPTVPASATALTNPFDRDASVVVFGGAVSDISVDSQSQGITSGLVSVPSGKTVTLTYTIAPSWAWTLL